MTTFKNIRVLLSNAASFQDLFDIPAIAFLPAAAGVPALAVGVRQIVATYSGPLFRLQKGGDVGSGGTTFDVPTLSNGLPNAHAAVSWANGEEMRMAVIYDQSSNARDLVPSAWALMPIYDPASIYGKISRRGPFTSMMFDGWFSTPSTRVTKSVAIPASVTMNRQSTSVFDVFDPKSALYNQTFWTLLGGSHLGAITAAGETGFVAAEFTNKSSGRRPRQKFQTIGITSGTTALKIFQDNQLFSFAQAGSAVIAGGWLGVGSSGPTGNTDFIDTSNRLAFVIYPTALSDANAQAVRDTLNATFGLTYNNASRQIILSGDSNHYGAQVTGSQKNRTLTREIREVLPYEAEFYNMALSSQQLTGAGGQIANAATREDLLLADGTYTNRTFISLIGGNDLANNGGTAGYGATLYSAHVAELARLKSIGATRTVIGTIPIRGVFSSGQFAIEWADYNARVRANSGGVDAVADIAAWFTGERANFSNPIYWQESTHWTGYVNSQLAPIIAAVI